MSATILRVSDTPNEAHVSSLIEDRQLSKGTASFHLFLRQNQHLKIIQSLVPILSGKQSTNLALIISIGRKADEAVDLIAEVRLAFMTEDFNNLGMGFGISSSGRHFEWNEEIYC